MKAATNHQRSMAQYWGRRAKPATVPEGATPIQCQPFNQRAAGVMQHLDCARRNECLTYAMRMGWRAFCCSYCAVREKTPTVELATRRGSDEPSAWPNPK